MLFAETLQEYENLTKKFMNENRRHFISLARIYNVLDI